MVFTNPLINMSQAAAEMAGLEDFATIQLNAPFSLTLQPSFLSLFNEFLLPNAVVSDVQRRLALIDSCSFRFHGIAGWSALHRHLAAHTRRQLRDGVQARRTPRPPYPRPGQRTAHRICRGAILLQRRWRDERHPGVAEQYLACESPD